MAREPGVPAAGLTAPPPGRGWPRAPRAALLAGAQLVVIACGVALALTGRGAAGDAAWALVAAVTLVVLTWSAGRQLLRGQVGVDIIAWLAIAGALALGEYLAGAIVALMLGGGTALEEAADRRARRELSALVARAPAFAERRVGGTLQRVPVGEIVPGDVVVVRAGEVLPVDGEVEGGEAVLDESALTGEPLPVTHPPGASVRSGTANAGSPFDLRAGRPASESAYAAIVRLVEEAGAQRAPFVRMADRYAVVLLVVTVVLAAVAWAASGDPVRALAVLVVATPCPLILAAPVALVSGVSRAARRGVIAKGSTAIERLGRARTVLLDKTGTLTGGVPEVDQVVALGPVTSDELLRLAASVEQMSANVVGRAVVRAARARSLALAAPQDVVEGPGMGVEGRVEGRRVVAGSPHWLERRGCAGADGARANDARGHVLVAIDGTLAGDLRLADAVRSDAAEAVAGLRAAGVTRIAILSGDAREPAEAIGRRLGVDDVRAELAPADKLRVVEEMRGATPGGTVVMVGDGINDAPALSAADVGVAMAGGEATVSSQAADVVIPGDRVERVAEAVAIGRRSLDIARQSVVVGISLSGLAMIAAALGYLPPVAGALLQEVIDVAVILNALRALRG